MKELNEIELKEVEGGLQPAATYMTEADIAALGNIVGTTIGFICGFFVGLF
jgi:hypothetical protein